MKSGTDWVPEADGLVLVRVQAGIGYFLHSPICHELKSSDMVVFATTPGAYFRSSQLGALDLQFFLLKPDLLSGVLTLAERTAFENITALISKQPRFYADPNPIAFEFSQIANTPGKSSFAFRCQMLQLVSLLFEKDMPQPTFDDEPANASERFFALINKLSETDWQNQRLPDLAKMCGCSERHFSRLFHRHFGTGVRSKQLALRLKTAKRLLHESDTKVINVALESGFRSLGLFNTMFKKHFGMTPSDWRQQSNRKRRRSPLTHALAALLIFHCFAPVINAATNSPPVQPVFKVNTYHVTGNTILSPAEISTVLTNFTGTNVTVAQIIQSQKALNLLYRRKGYVTISTTLPPQKITNGVVELVVTEGRLADITITGNRYYSEENIRRALPSLKTNVLLQTQWFSPELDRANANPDRQIYPEITPGPDPGTSAIILKIKDQLPLHGRLEINNLSTPATPDLRVNSSLQYNNLWQQEHSVGVQYSFSPQQFKDTVSLPTRFYDVPLIASYSTYYRLPLLAPEAMSEIVESQPGSFGYDEVSKQFRLPTPSGVPEMNVFASRSSNDTGVKFGDTSTVLSTPLVTVQSLNTGQDITLNDDFGFRLSLPLKEVGRLKSTLSAGLDFKYFRLTSYNTNNFPTLINITNSVGTAVPITQNTASPQPVRDYSLTYIPISARWDGNMPDKYGNFSAFANVSWNLPVFSRSQDFQNLTGSTEARATYLTLQSGFSREQKLFGNYTLLLHADGQWANTPLISNEQFGIGGSAGVRGYQEGEQYGDTGWRASIEPRTPFFDLGPVDGTMPMRARASIFMDYGELYSIDPGGRPTRRLWGTGLGLQSAIGQRWDFRFTFGWALADTGLTHTGDFRGQFAVGIQF